MKKEKVLSAIKETMQEIMNHPLDEAYTNIDIDTNTMFITHDFDEDGPINYYYRLVDINDNIYLVDCKENGTPFNCNKEDIIEMYSPLNKLTKYQIRYDIMDLNIFDTKQID